MNSPLSRITPGHVSQAAKAAALLLAFALTSGYVTGLLTMELAGIGAFFLSVMLLLALPGQRSSELLGALAVWLTYGEFMAAIQTGHFDLWRWATVLATLSLVIVPIKVQHLRQLARSNPYRPINAQDRRGWQGTMPSAAGAPYAPTPQPYAPKALLSIGFDSAAPDADPTVDGSAAAGA